MARVEWSALGGDEVESLLANLIYNHDGRAIRIRPSQGDYGIDIVIPTTADPEKWDVYQIKKFAQNLTANQKSQIVKSFGRVLLGMVRRNVPLNDWYLVLPLDPTLENLEWLKGVPEQAIDTLKRDGNLQPQLTDEELGRIQSWLEVPGRVIEWKGLPFCESLAAAYPYVVDYYLHGGRERLREAVADLAKMLGQDSGVRELDEAANAGEGTVALLEPGEITEHLARLDRVLDTDPHYRYDFSLDSGRPDVRAEPWSVAATQLQIRDDRWLTFKIYARSAQSLDERPIPLKLTFQFEEMSEDHESFKDWLKYGKAFDGNAALETDLPGGLGTGGTSGRVMVAPAYVSRNKFRNRQQIVGPDGTVLAELTYTLTATSGPVGTGIRVHGEDDSGLITVESLFDVETQSGTMLHTLKPLPGVVASKALPAIIFARYMCQPNILRVADEYGPFEDQLELTASETIVSEDTVEVIRDLSTVQQRTSVPVLIPDFHDYTLDDLKDIRRAAWLIEGRTVIQKWTTFEVPVHPHIEVEPGSHYTVEAGQVLRLRKITGEVVLGLVRQLVPSSTIASVEGKVARLVPYEDDRVYHSLVDSLPGAPPGKVAVLFAPIPEDQEGGTELADG